MEQPALLSIMRADTVYRFRLDLPEGLKDLTFVGQEHISELSSEQSERLKRALQSAAQQMRTMGLSEVKQQTTKLSAVNDSLLLLGRLLFDMLVPPQIQEALRHLDAPLILD